MSGVDLIAAERQRQIEHEGWTPAHDDEHDDFDLTAAAICYSLHAAGTRFPGLASGDGPPPGPIAWPWGGLSWKPSDEPITDLVKAGALIAAEIDRLQRRG